MTLRLAAAATGLLCLSGCAYVTATPVAGPYSGEGIFVPEHVPILIVEETATRIDYVPSPNKGYALKFGSFLAKHNFTASFAGARLTQIGSDQDSTGVAIALIQNADKVAGALATGFSDKAAIGGSARRLGVFAFRFSPDGDIVGLTPLLTPGGLIPLPRREASSGYGQGASLPVDRTGVQEPVLDKTGGA